MNKNNNLRLALMSYLTSNIYYFLISNILFYLSIALSGIWLIVVTPNLMNIVVIGLMFPGFAALVSCGVKYKESKNKTAFKVLKTFIEGYKKNFKDTIKYCFIYTVIIFVVIFNINYYGSDMPMFMIIALIVLTTLSTLILTYMMLIATKFQFRTKDLLKVSVYCILMHLKITIKIFIIYVILFFAYPWVGIFTMFLFISPIVYLIIYFAFPVLEDVYKVFVEKTE